MRIKNNVDTSKELPTVISFCSGYGGIERGLDLAGLEHRVIAYVEIEAYAIANLVAKMETGQLVPAPIYTDLKTFPAHLFRDCASIITGGYPCQPFSAAGKRLGTEDPRHLWPYILGHIKAIRPVRCMFENVEGHISLGLREVIGDLESAGYDATWGIFSAAEVGAPHQRKRVYILANAEGQRYGAGREQRDIYQADGGSVGECLSESTIAGSCAGGDEIVADSNSTRQQPDSGTVQESKVGDNAGRSSSELANASRQCTHGTGGGRQIGRDESSDSGLLADSVSTRSASGVSGSQRPDEEGQSGISANGDSEQGGGSLDVHWPVEPRLGRVVDGCANRVDRIRLLGNGVVPQTAAKAWRVLSSRFAS
jgi:DNA (cytosine-5)-methyltransferase 1